MWLVGCKREGEREREKEGEEREREREGERKGGEFVVDGEGGFGPRDFFGFCASCALIVSSQRRLLVVLSVMEGEGC